MSCSSMENCPFFNDRLANMPSMAEIYKKKYCQGDNFSSCARYRVATTLGKEFVPTSLFPNMAGQADSIINAHNRIESK
jgi:hypothetical protein